MNFVAHYFLDRDHPEAFYAIGAATPDLLSIYNPRLRIKKHHTRDIDRSQLTDPHIILLDGVERHFHADAVFHSSEFFKEQTTWLSNELKKRFEEDEVPRRYFVAHVLLELILDKAIISRHKDLLETYYEHYDQSELKLVREATEEVSQNKLPNYESFLQKFRENRYLFRYSEWNHIVFVLRKVMDRVRIPNQKFAESKAFRSLMEEFEDQLGNTYETVFREIRETAMD